MNKPNSIMQVVRAENVRYFETAANFGGVAAEFSPTIAYTGTSNISESKTSSSSCVMDCVRPARAFLTNVIGLRTNIDRGPAVEVTIFSLKA